jgi:hypothetical protein
MYEPLSREFLLSRGKCCKNSCINCPWDYKMKKIKFSILGQGTYEFDPSILKENEELTHFVISKSDGGAIDILPMVNDRGKQYGLNFLEEIPFEERLKNNEKNRRE